MALIPAQPIVDKETLSLRLERVVHERLKQYAAFIQSPKDYVIGQALRRLFEKDHEFTEWLKTHDSASSTNGAAGNGNGEEVVPGLRTRARTSPSRAEAGRSVTRPVGEATAIHATDGHKV
jgi:hypothetical protein